MVFQCEGGVDLPMTVLYFAIVNHFAKAKRFQLGLNSHNGPGSHGCGDSSSTLIALSQCGCAAPGGEF